MSTRRSSGCVGRRIDDLLAGLDEGEAHPRPFLAPPPTDRDDATRSTVPWQPRLGAVVRGTGALAGQVLSWLPRVGTHGGTGEQDEGVDAACGAL